MSTTPPHRNSVRAIVHKFPLLLAAVRFEHTLFALPFAYIGMFLAADGLPYLKDFLWITLAMGAARTLAMSCNRLLHMKEDASNPRTAGRHLPSGQIKPREMALLILISLGIFFFASSQLNTLALALSPVAAFIVVFYSYVKYYSWTTHFVLGWADGIAPAAAWIGVTGNLPPEAILLSSAMAAWVSGFDILYACQDYEFDRLYGVHSIPRRFGIPSAIWVARSMHFFTSVALLGLGIWMDLAFPYYIGWVIGSLLLAYEHFLVRPHDLSKLNKAFFNINSYVALILLFFTTLAVLP